MPQLLFTPPPWGKTRYPLYRRLGGPQGRSGQVRKILPPLGFDPRTIQPVASRYTNYATWPTILIGFCQIFSWIALGDVDLCFSPMLVRKPSGVEEEIA